jgi:hypothetical protein
MMAMDEQAERVVVALGDQRHQAFIILVIGEHGLFLGHRLVLTPGRGLELRLARADGEGAQGA